MSFIRVAWVVVAVHCSKTLTKIPMKSQPYTNKCGQLRKVGSKRGGSSPRRRTPIGLYTAKWLALKRYIQVIWIEPVTFRNVYVYTYMHVITITNKKEAINLKENG